MVIDFSKVSAKETPVLILRNLDGTAIQTLGCAHNLKAELCYNEVSTITFDLPKYVDGIATPKYKDVIGTRIIDMDGWGQFLLVDPSTENDGIKEIKNCKAYSLEYEFTKKKMSLEENTYNFWNPAAPSETVLGIILEYMPSWSVGTVDSALVGKYRTFSVSYENIYDFIKSTLQKTYSCIFEFDTYQRKINVRHTDTNAENTSVYISLNNLAKKISVSEDTENIFTVLDVNGADGVDIRNVNPLGTNKIYNLDYFMNTSHFSQAMITKWEAWKAECEQNELQYYNLSIERMLKISEILTLQNRINEKRDVTLASLKNIQSTKLELIAGLYPNGLYLGLSTTAPTHQNGVSEPGVGGYARVKFAHVTEDGDNGTVENSDVIVFPTCTGVWFDGQGDELTNYWVLFDSEVGGEAVAYGAISQPRALVVGDIMRFQAGEIVVTLANVSDVEANTYLQTLAQLQDLNDQIDQIEDDLRDMEQALDGLGSDRDALTQQLVAINTACALSSFFTSSELLILDRYFIEDSISESSFVVSSVKDYVDAGYSSQVTNATIDYENAVVTKFLSYTNREIYTIEGGTITFDTPSITANVIKSVVEIKQDNTFVLTAYLGSGTLATANFQSGCISMSGSTSGHQDTTEEDEETNGAYATGYALQIWCDDGQLYFTTNATAYEQYAVEWDLLSYGRDCLSKLAFPSYTFSVDAENFFALDEYIQFVNKIGLGKRIYLQMEDGVLTPILVKVSLEFNNLPTLSLEFGSTYNASDSAFHLVDLLEQSVSMGKTVDTSRFNYNSFIDSGASTAVKDFMDAALDVSKNAVLSGTNMDISWDSSGMHFRKANTNGGYEPEEIAIINNNIVFTDDGWDSAKMAIGHFVDANTGDAWGIVAPNIVGTLLAGQNLVIESNKKDGGVSVFRVDGNGALLHNARFDIEDSNRHILLDPQLGFAIGAYPVVKQVNGADTIDIGTAANPGKAKLWVDTDGNVYIRGTLQGCDGTFTGELRAGSIYGAAYYDENGNLMTTNGKFKPGYLELRGLSIVDNNNNTTLSIDSNGNVRLSGNSVIDYSSVGNTPSIPTVPSYITSTGITSTSIWSPSIYGGALTIAPAENHAGTITVKNSNGVTTFSVDNSGNVTASSITIGGQTSIDWTDIQETGKSAGQLLAEAAQATANAAQTAAGGAQTAATNADNAAKAHFGTCSTGSSTANKVVVCANFTLFTGATVTVKFDHKNTAANPMMNVQSTGNEPMYAAGAPISGVFNWGDGDIVTFIYDGDHWVMSDTSALHTVGSWCHNNNLTYIDGGHIYTGTIACDKLAAGTIDANNITLGSAYGGFCTAQGNDGTNTTYGAKMFGSDGINGDYYFIATNGGVRMQAGDANIFASNSRTKLEVNSSVSGAAAAYFMIEQQTGGSFLFETTQNISTTSDRKMKHDISYDMSIYKDFFLDLKPVSFLYNGQGDRKKHIGLVAQDVEDAINAHGISIEDVSLVTKYETIGADDTKTERYSVAYGELTALNTSMIQDLISEVEILKQKIALLEGEQEEE